MEFQPSLILLKTNIQKEVHGSTQKSMEIQLFVTLKIRTKKERKHSPREPNIRRNKVPPVLTLGEIEGFHPDLGLFVNGRALLLVPEVVHPHPDA